MLEKIDVWLTHYTSHNMSVDYERLSYLLAQSKQLEAYGETDLVHAVWNRIIELLTSALDEHTESAIDFIPDLPTPTPSESGSEPDDKLEGMTRKELLVIWNVDADYSWHSCLPFLFKVQKLYFKRAMIATLSHCLLSKCVLSSSS